MLLNELKPGDNCVIEKLTGDNILKQRMMTMGIVPGVEISILKYAPLGDPIEIKLKNCNLSLRLQEAATVCVSKIT